MLSLGLALGAGVAVGALADLCLLACPWEKARAALDSRLVRMTWIDGARIYGSD